jgi:integrase
MNAAVAPVALVVTKSDFEQAIAANPKMTGAGSRFDDEIWDLSTEMAAVRKPPCAKRINFRMRARGHDVVKYSFPEGKGLVDYPSFHTHAKRLIAAMILSPRNKLGPVFAASTLLKMVGALRRVYCHLAREGYTELESVPRWGFESFTKAIEVYPSGLLVAFRLLHLYRDLVPAFTFDPWQLAMATPAAQAGARARYQNPTEPIPDPAFRQLLRVCVAYVQERAGPILDAREALARVRAERTNKSLTAYPSKERRFAHQSVWERIEVEKIYPDHVGPRAHLCSAERVQDACRHLQMAAVALLFATTGMRLNELLTISSGCIKRTTDGDIPRVWIESTHSKYADRAAGDRARWLCSSIGEQAVAVLARLSEPTRRESRSDYLIGPLAERGRHRIKNMGTTYKGGSANTFFSPRFWWRRFLHEHRIANGDGKVAHIHSHQFRRTFARWCALSDSTTSLLALKDHFKHASILMTRHYAQIDDELLLLFELEKERISAESFDKVLRAEALGGIGGHLIKRNIDAAIEVGELPRNFRGVAGARVRKECIQNWLQSGVQMRACAGHYCVPIDPHVACAETNSIGCNKGTCRNAVFHPEHAPGLAEKIRNDRRTLGKVTEWTPGAPYVERLREHIHVQEKILSDLSIPTRKAKIDERT